MAALGNRVSVEGWVFCAPSSASRVRIVSYRTLISVFSIHWMVTSQRDPGCLPTDLVILEGCVCVCVCWGWVMVVGVTRVLRLMRARNLHDPDWTFRFTECYSEKAGGDTVGPRAAVSHLSQFSCYGSLLPLLCHVNIGSSLVGLRCREFGTDLGTFWNL